MEIAHPWKAHGTRLQNLTSQGAPSSGSAGTGRGVELERQSQVPWFVSGEMQQRNGSSCSTVRKVTEHVNLKLSAAKVVVHVSHINVVYYL